METFERVTLPNGDWFASMNAFKAVLNWAGAHGYNLTVADQIEDDTELYGLIVRHALRDVYIVPWVIAAPGLRA
jgi:hypothetical protein